MTLELINPDDLPLPESYTHVVVARGTRMVFVAGQVAEDGKGDLVASDDLAGQARQAFANLGRALAAAGARPEQVTKLTIYVVAHRPEYLPDISAGSRCSATTSPPTPSWASRRWPRPAA